MINPYWILGAATVLFLAGALLCLDGRNKRYDADARLDRVEWLAREVARAGGPTLDFGPTGEQRPVRPLFYRRRHRITLRQRYQQWEVRRPFDIAAGWDDELAPVPVRPLPPVAAGVVEAEQIADDPLDAELAELAKTFARIEKVGAR